MKERVCTCCGESKENDEFLFANGKQCKECYKEKKATRGLDEYKRTYADPVLLAKRTAGQRKYHSSQKGRLTRKRFNNLPEQIAKNIERIYQWLDNHQNCSESTYNRMYYILGNYQKSLDTQLYDNGDSLYGLLHEKIVHRF